jgi:mannose-6-phosphate isomerase-like protein (cupin superfamily)
MAKVMLKRFSSPDETRRFEHGRAEIVKLGEGTVGRGVFEPGWRWSNDVRPVANTRSCEVAHACYVVSGRMHIAMDDGDEVDVGPGDYVVIPPGHDAWTLGDAPCVLIDTAGMEHYAQRPETRAEHLPAAQPGMGL